MAIKALEDEKKNLIEANELAHAHEVMAHLGLGNKERWRIPLIFNKVKKGKGLNAVDAKVWNELTKEISEHENAVHIIGAALDLVEEEPADTALHRMRVVEEWRYRRQRGAHHRSTHKKSLLSSSPASPPAGQTPRTVHLTSLRTKGNVSPGDPDHSSSSSFSPHFGATAISTSLHRELSRFETASSAARKYKAEDNVNGPALGGVEKAKSHRKLKHKRSSTSFLTDKPKSKSGDNSPKTVTKVCGSDVCGEDTSDTGNAADGDDGDDNDNSQRQSPGATASPWVVAGNFVSTAIAALVNLSTSSSKKRNAKTITYTSTEESMEDVDAEETSLLQSISVPKPIFVAGEDNSIHQFLSGIIYNARSSFTVRISPDR